MLASRTRLLRRWFVFLGFLGSLGWFSSSALAATYYVSPSGNDSNAGTLSSPWRTITKAANTAAAGDTVHIRAGTYREHVKISNSGTASSRIVFRAYSGESPLQDGSGLGGGYGFSVTGDYVTLDGLSATGNGWTGIAASQAHNVIFRNCRATSNGRNAGGIGYYNGIELWETNNALIEGCVAEQNGFHGIAVYYCTNATLRTSTSRQNDGIVNDSDGFHFGESTTILVEDCISEDNLEDGFDVSQYSVPYNGCSDVKIINCISRRNEDAGFSNNSKSNNITYINNLSYDNEIGFNFYDNVANVKLYHNTNYGGRSFMAFGDSHRDFDIRNNNFAGNDFSANMFIAQIHSGLTMNYNNIWNYGTGAALGFFLGSGSSCNPGPCGKFTNQQVNDGTLFSQTGLEQKGKAVNPLFVSTTSRDLHLTASSPVIGAGLFLTTPTEVQRDREEKLRPNPPSLGAYEFTVAPPPISAPQNLRIIP